MTHTTHEKGFTLVELAIVLVIVGLLIAGILKGQELIANSQVTATINQMNGLDAATSTFRDKYRGFPGDLSTADAKLPNCAADPCDNGDGDGRLAQNAGGALLVGDEGTYFFNHLRADGLVTGFDGTADVSFGAALPAASVGGGFLAGYSDGSTMEGAGAGASGRPGHYIAVVGQNADQDGTTGVMNAAQAGRVDNKLDDGNPDTGSVIGIDECQSGTTAGTYDGEDAAVLCTVYYRIQG